MTTSCKPEEVDEPEKPDDTVHLTGTSWKLAGYVDTETETFIAAEPADCETCYTLTFENDSVARGYVVINRFGVLLKPTLIMGLETLVYDAMNGNVALLYEAMDILESYSHEGDEFKFFYNDGTKYLLFKKQ